MKHKGETSVLKYFTFLFEGEDADVEINSIEPHSENPSSCKQDAGPSGLYQHHTSIVMIFMDKNDAEEQKTLAGGVLKRKGLKQSEFIAIENCGIRGLRSDNSHVEYYYMLAL